MQSINDPTHEVPAVGDFSDILFLDKEISGSLKQKYLTPYENPSMTAMGVLFGPYARPIVCLPVTPLGKEANLAIHSLVDTGAPTTFLSEEALKVLFGVNDLAIVESTNVNIWGTKLAVSPSTAHWPGINLLGANYLRKANIKLECIYNEDPSTEMCVLNKKIDRIDPIFLFSLLQKQVVFLLHRLSHLSIFLYVNIIIFSNACAPIYHHLQYQFNGSMSLISSSCSLASQERHPLVELPQKENIFITSFKEVKTSTTTKINTINIESNSKHNLEIEELSFRAKGLETQVLELKNNEVRLKEELRTEKTMKTVIEKELIEVKEYLRRQQRIEQNQNSRKLQLELTERTREIELTKQQLNSERLRYRIDNQKQKKRTEELQQIRNQIQSYHFQFEQSKLVEKQLQQKLVDCERIIIELKFEKNTLVEQLKFLKSEKESLFKSASQEKCEELISVTRQLNQMSLECAKWRTQWEQLRSQQEASNKQRMESSAIQAQQQKVIRSLRQELELKQQSEMLFEEEILKAREEVAKIQESERIRKEEIIKKDRYVLKLETQTKKFQSECQLKIKEIESSYEAKISSIKEEKQQIMRERDEKSNQVEMRTLRLDQANEQRTHAIMKMQEQESEVQQLTAQNCLLSQELSHLKRKLVQKEEMISSQLTNVNSLQQQICLLISQHQTLIQSHRELQITYQHSLESISKQSLESVNSQLKNLQDQLQQKKDELKSLVGQNSMLRRSIKQCQEQHQFLKSQREQQLRKFKTERERLKKELAQKEIILRVARSESMGMEQIMNEEMEKRNQVIEQLVKEAREKKY